MAPLIIGRPDQKGSTGRDNRMFVEGVLWIVRTGSPWRDLPEAFGDWNSVFRRFSRWSVKGVWWRIFEAMSDDPDFEYLIVQVAGIGQVARPRAPSAVIRRFSLEPPDRRQRRHYVSIVGGKRCPILRPVNNVEKHSAFEHLRFQLASMSLPVRRLPDPESGFLPLSFHRIVSRQRAADALVHHRETVVGECRVIHFGPLKVAAWLGHRRRLTPATKDLERSRN
jgi:putative transposase